MFYVRKLDRGKKKATILVYLNYKWVFSTIQTLITKKINSVSSGLTST